MKNRILPILLVCLCVAIPANGKKREFKLPNPREYIEQNPQRAAVNGFHYEVLDSSVTAAPRGYEPFYISHISRHGSRGHCGTDDLRMLDSLKVYDKAGMLTKDGQWLISQLSAVQEENERLGYGALTDRGAWEQREIARRMGAHYPEVFSNATRTKVDCYSTAVPRVMNSMENFTLSLGSSYTGLDFVKSYSDASKRAKYETKSKAPSKKQKDARDEKGLNAALKSQLKSFDWTPLANKTFIDGKVPAHYAKSPGRLFASIFGAGSIYQCFLNPNLEPIEPYFTTDELYTIWEQRNMRTLYTFNGCEENNYYKIINAPRVLNCIIEDADAVISGEDASTCATIRFTHDGYIQPVMSLMGLQGSTYRGSVRGCEAYYNGTYTIHMASNVQMVFYRKSGGKSGDVLVKFLLNEEEVILPQLKPDYKGLFYKWSRVKEWWQSKK